MFSSYLYILQIQLESLKEKKARNDQVIDALQKTIREKELEIQKLTQQIPVKEIQVQQDIYTQNPVEFQNTDMLLELQDMKMKIINSKDELHRMRTEVNLAQDEANYYKTLAVTLQTALQPTKVKSCIACKVKPCMPVHSNRYM